MKTYILLLAIAAGFAAVCTASPCTLDGQYTQIHGSHAVKTPALPSLNDALASKPPPGRASYRVSVQRADVVAVCSLVKAGAEYKTYLPLKFNEGAVRMIKPVAANLGCHNAAKGADPSKLQLSFKLLDSAEVGVVTCPASKRNCDVYLYESTGSQGYNKETIGNSTSKPSHGRKLR